MLSQIRQKKKKEAVRRLSQGSGNGFRQQLPRRKSSDQQQTQRGQPNGPNQKPAKKSHVSPLHQEKANTDGTESTIVKSSVTAGFSFGVTKAESSAPFTQSRSDTPVSSFPAVTGSGSSFPVPEHGESKSASLADRNFGSGFGLSSSTAQTSWSSPLAPSSLSSLITSQPLNPIFGPDFNKNTFSTSVPSSSGVSNARFHFEVGDGLVTEPSSTNLTFGSFSNRDTFTSSSGSSNSLMSSQGFADTSEMKTTTTSLAFGVEGETSDSSAVAKPLFPTVSSSSSTLNAAKADKGKSGARLFVRSFAFAKEGLQQNEYKEKSVVKTTGLGSTANLTSLVIKDIPEMYNKNTWLKKFYSRFGEVIKVVCSAARQSATVTFKAHEAAEAAKKKGKILRPGLPPVMIFWKQRRRSAASESDELRTDVGKSVGESPEKAVLRKVVPVDKPVVRSVKKTEVMQDIQKYLQTLEPSENAGEKLQVLEGIDKKLRQVFKRSSDITSAKAVCGTCKDMCPEKERYMREYQRRLSVFEAIPGTGSIDENPQVDHTRAIKEYDRSAADKEEPLPHELRPVPVLKMTMDYLATNVMDLVELGREGEWFDFLWNRTRGIRKDITQQHLCDPDCVDLVEKTARFHIICAHLLCEADMNSFDAKINTENLTKCLQTLKQFYGDLYKDKGITCPREAEFRAYDILLNLNEGDILREAMTFRDEVQKSAEVQFAMAVFHALNSNNAVRFFRLVRNAKYLSACLLHRYFTQVRSKAAQTLNHSLSIPNRTTQYPLKDLIEMLAFENESEAGEFCSFHGLTVFEGCVHFSRSSFIEPETRFSVKRALKLIESKRNSSVGEVVYNGALPPPPQHRPVLSFNERGEFIGDTEELLSDCCKEDIPPSEAHDQSNVTSAVLLPGRQKMVTCTSDRQVSITASTAVGIAKPQGQTFPRPFTQSPQSPPKPAVVCSGEEITQFTKSLFLEVLNEMCTEITKEAIDKVHSYLQLSTKIFDNLFEKVLREFINDTAKKALTEERNIKRIAEENAACQERVSRAIHVEVISELVSIECARIVEEVTREEREELIKIARDKASEEICLMVLNEGVLIELQNLALEVLDEKKAERDSKLQQLAVKVKRSRTARYFSRWVKCYRKYVHLKGLLSSFPPGAPMMSTEEQLRHLVGHNRRSISMASIRTDSNGNGIREALKRRQTEMDHVREQACRPLDISSILADSVRSQLVAEKSTTSASINWKLVISFPENHGKVGFTASRDRGQLLSFVVKERFKRGVYPLHNNIPQGLRRKIDLLSLYKEEKRNFPPQSKVFKICTKACYGVLTNTEAKAVLDSKQFLGTNAVMLVLDWRELHISQQAIREAHIRLRRILESKPPEPRLPVAVIMQDSDSTSPAEAEVLALLGIRQLRADRLLSECKLHTVQSLDNLSQKLHSAITWLGQRTFVASLPKTDSLVNFVEDGLHREFVMAASEDLFVRKQAKLDQQCPEAIVELFNSVVDHLAAVVSSNNLQRMSWPISEFTEEQKTDLGVPHLSWNSFETLQRLRSCITALKLPPPPPAAADGLWETECHLCLEYARSLSPKTTSLLNRVRWILAREKRVQDQISLLLTSPSLSASRVPWPLVLDACVNFRLTGLHSDADLVEQDVFFLEDELNAFVQPSLWRQAVNISKEESAKAKSKDRLEATGPKQNKDTKLHESFLDIEQQLDKIKGTFQVDSTSSPQMASQVLPLPTVPLVSDTPSSENERSIALSDFAVQTSSDRLKVAVEDAKLGSKRFEELLKKTLGKGDSCEELEQKTFRKRKAQSLGESKKSPKLFQGLDLPEIDISFGSLEQSLSCFNETLRSQRFSDQYAETRLKDCLES